MRKLLLLLLILSFGVVNAQYAPTSAKTKFVNALAIGSKDTGTFAPIDTMVLTIARDSAMYYRYKGYWKPLATGGNLTNYVPYVGATNNLYLGTHSLYTDAITFKTTSITATDSIARMKWDTTYRTAKLGLGGGNVQLQIGQEELVLIHNGTGSTLTDGQVVYITGSTGELPSVALASDTSEARSSVTLGVVTESIGNGSDGFVTISGMVHGLNTNSLTEGKAIWLGTTPGTFTDVKPQAPKNAVLIGYVVKKSGGNGSIFVKIQNGYELDELHDVKITKPVLNQSILIYDSINKLWVDTLLSAVAPTTDTTSLSNRINQRVKYTDTASMLSPYKTSYPRQAISLTTTGTSGLATYNNSTGVINVPQYQAALTNPVTGTGTIDYLPKWTSSSALGNSGISDDGSWVTLNSRVLSINTNGQGFTFTTYKGANSTGSNIFIGNGGFSSVGSVADNTLGSYNASLGVSSMFSNTEGFYNTAIGAGALYANTTGYANTSVGVNSSVTNTTGTYNTVVGFSSMYSNTTGFYNTTLGAQALQNNTTGNHNIAIGLSAGGINTTGSGNIFIGEDPPVSATESNRTFIGNTSTTSTWLAGSVLIGTKTNTGSYALDVNGTGRFSGALTGTSATFNGSGTTTTLSLQASNGVGSLRWLNGAGTSIWTTYSPSGTYLSIRDVVYGVDVMSFNQNSAAIQMNVPLTGTSATFSSSVTANGGRVTIQGTNQNAVWFNQNAGGTSTGFLIGRSYGSTDSQDFFIYDVAAGAARMFINSSGNVLIGTTTDDGTNKLQVNGSGIFSSTIKTGAPSSGSAMPWKLGQANSGSVTTNYYIYVEINGQIYSIPALLGTP